MPRRSSMWPPLAWSISCTISISAWTLGETPSALQPSSWLAEARIQASDILTRCFAALSSKWMWGLIRVRNAEFMKSELRVTVRDSMVGRMSRARGADAACAEGVLIAREMLQQVRGLVQGAQVAAPLGRYSSAIDVLDGQGGASCQAANGR